MDASFEPKKLPNPPMVLLMSGRVEAGAGGGESSITVAGIDFAPLGSEPVSTCCVSRSRSLLATSLRTPSNALKRLVDPAAKTVPIASRVGAS